MPLRLILWCRVFAANFLRAGQIDDCINQQLQSLPVPGVALTVLRNGKEIKTAAYEVANLELDVPTTRESVFEIGALSAQFTTAAIMLLSEEGELSLDDPINRYLPAPPSSWANS